ncbi:Ribonuclease kappa [Trichinella spiralis]|uniref:Ribonuclease kappa n=1 Tax=Trichinella spiralis TaxID=6334 RepID=A0A0V1BV90_TRISP|nr:Ribonuclease kappa [Trichinella spiralis]
MQFFLYYSSYEKKFQIFKLNIWLSQGFVQYVDQKLRCAVWCLGILGIMFYTQSPLLFEDIHYEKKASEFSISEISDRYQSTAYNCWIAAGGYVVTMIIAFWQTNWNNRLLFV